MTPTITTNELLDALHASRNWCPVRQDDAFTSSELVKATSWSLPTVKRHLHDMKASGGLEVVKVHREGLDGRVVTVSAYRFVSPKPLKQAAKRKR